MITNNIPLPGATTVAPTIELGRLLIAVIVPLIVAGVKFFTPKLPAAVIPPLAIVLGIVADYIGSLLGVWQGNILVGLALGAAGIGLREASVKVGRVVLPKAE